MTDQQPHTTTMQAILDLHQPGVRGIDVGFDYCEECRKLYPCETARLATVEVAAEKRGAIKALRSAAQFFSDPGGERFASWAAIQQYLNDRADQIEGDDER